MEKKVEKEVSIIIVNYKCKELISNCVNTICKYLQDLDYEILIIDNNTEDLSELKRISKNVRIIQLHENVGFGNANNIASEDALGKYLFFLNPDTLLLNNAVSILYNAMEADNKIGICGGNLYDAEERPVHSYNDISWSLTYILKLLLFPPNYIRSIKRQHNFSDNLKKVGYITGADLMISKDIFKKVGGFSKKIFMYYEDVDLCYRVHQLGLNIVSVPSARIIHLEGQAPVGNNNDERSRRKKDMNRKGQRIFLATNYSFKYALFLIIIFQIVLKIREKILLLFRRNVKKNRDAQKELVKLYNELKEYETEGIN